MEKYSIDLDDYKLDDDMIDKFYSSEGFVNSYNKDLQDNLYEKLFNLFISTCFFSFIPHNYTAPYNCRQTFMQAYFIKKYVEGKHFCHIGCAEGDLELLLSKYAKKMTIIETETKLIEKAIEKKNKSLYSCPVEIINDNFFNRNIEADVYFTWCGQGADYSVINFILQKYNKCKIISPCLPYYYWKKYNLKNYIPDNFLLPFDENLNISYYNSRMLKNKNNIIIEHKDSVFLYDCCDDYNIKLIDIIEKGKFNFENYKEYQHPYSLNGIKPGYWIEKLVETDFPKHRQNSSRGYITLGVLDVV
tara:strand:+ start:2835 stop:3743 length:909 start_codon:yes stop_codon:yes gene_type:complete